MTSSSAWLLRRIRPLWLREKLFYRIGLRIPVHERAIVGSGPLQFAAGTTLSLTNTDIGHRLIAGAGFFELAVSRAIAALADKGGLLVDVGANFGYYPCIWAARNPQNRVIAFEPLPANIAALKRNVAANGFDSRVQIHPVAVGRQPGTASFRYGARDQTGQGGFVADNTPCDTKVPVTTLDEQFKGSAARIAVLKIDAEGADTWVIEGADGLLKQHRIEHVFFEQFPERMEELGINAARASEFLRARGYEVTEIMPDEFHATLGRRA